MKLILVAAILLSVSCKTADLPPAADPGAIYADAKTCAEGPVHDLALDSLDDFATALVSANYAGAVASVVTGIAKSIYNSFKDRAEATAWTVAKCSVQAIQEKVTKHVKFGALDAATLERERLMLGNADAWLAGH